MHVNSPRILQVHRIKIREERSVLTYVLDAHGVGSFEYPQHMFWLRNKKIIFLLHCHSSDFFWQFLPPHTGVIPNPKMAFIFPISCFLAFIFPFFMKYFPKCSGKGSFPKSQIKSLHSSRDDPRMGQIHFMRKQIMFC